MFLYWISINERDNYNNINIMHGPGRYVQRP